jgi:polar amino acid transport system ATP-binding protein
MSAPGAISAEPVSIGVDGITLSYDRTTVLREASLSVARGSTTCVIGPSGSGKSTLLRVMNRLVEPDRGRVLLDGEDVTALGADALRRRVGMVFQHFHLFPHMSVLRNVMFGLRTVQRLPASHAEEIARDYLERVGLQHKADVRPTRLSGGQQQRVAIARALAMQPQVMLFDEVTSALDPELVKGVLSLLGDLSSGGMTMVVVTHEMGFARNVADRVAFMSSGRITEAGPPAALFDDPQTPRLQRFLDQVL